MHKFIFLLLFIINIKVIILIIYKKLCYLKITINLNLYYFEISLF